MALYHYTTEARYKEILESGALYPSGDTQTDSVYGAGWYFTNLPPTTCEKILMGYCWERLTLHRRLDCFLQVEVVGGTAHWRRDQVYFVPQSPGIEFRLLNHGRTPECPLKPCHSCDQNPAT